ncbi:MAG: cytochrome b/b6 domain-containing protein, partial [Limnohabitans sp.]
MAYLIKVWDLPTRLFHWALVLLMLGSVISVLVFDNMVWHANCGYALAVLWLFRLLWGVVGGHWSRFRQMFFTWRQYLNYVRQASSCALPGPPPLFILSFFSLFLALFFPL